MRRVGFVASLGLLVLAGCVEQPAPPVDPGLTVPAHVALPAHAAWRALADALVPRAEMCASNIGPLFYVIGGLIVPNDQSLPGPAGSVPAAAPTARVDVYDAGGNKWATAPDYPMTLDHCLAVTVGETLYVINGAAAGGGSYKIAKGAASWVAIADPPHGHNAGVAEEIGGKIYATGGGSTAVDVYDPGSNAWTTAKGELPTSRGHTSGAVVDGRLYVIAGDVGGHAKNTDANEGYDPVADSWAKLAPIPVVRGSLHAVAWFGRVVAMGGQNGATNVPAFADVNAYDPLSDSWSDLPKMAHPRHGFAAGVWQDKIYVFGGAPQQGVSSFTKTDVLEAA